MAEIRVEPVEAETFRVTVREGASESRHEVRVSVSALEELGFGQPAERLLEESFRFLLEREPKESILRSFELPVIATYFREYKAEMRRRLGR